MVDETMRNFSDAGGFAAIAGVKALVRELAEVLGEERAARVQQAMVSEVTDWDLSDRMRGILLEFVQRSNG